MSRHLHIVRDPDAVPLPSDDRNRIWDLLEQRRVLVILLIATNVMWAINEVVK